MFFTGDQADKLIDEAKLDKIGVREQIYSLLKNWKRIRGDKATKTELIRALRDSDKIDLATKYSHSTDV